MKIWAFGVAERRPRLERHRRVNEMLERFRLTETAGRRPHEVSGGQRQRCSLARALIGGPRLLLLDEPTQGLDAPLRMELYEMLRQVHADFQTPVLLVTHDLDECFELGNEMLVLLEGRIAQSGPPREVLDRPANLEVARLLGAFNLLPGEIRTLDPGRNSSRLKIGEHEIDGPYFPGRLEGRPRLHRLRSAGAADRPPAQRPARTESNSRGAGASRRKATVRPPGVFGRHHRCDLPRRPLLSPCGRSGSGWFSFRQPHSGRCKIDVEPILCASAGG